MTGMSMLRFIDSGLSPDDVRHLVDTFHDRIQVHPVLGAVFNDVVEDRDEHKARGMQMGRGLEAGAAHEFGIPVLPARTGTTSDAG